MRVKELSAPHRARLFSALLAMDEQQAGWDKVFQLLSQGQQAAERAEIPELIDQFEQGQATVLASLRNTRQFLPWELELIQLGLAAGNVREVFLRIHEHYVLQQRFVHELGKQVKWPAMIVSIVLLIVMGFNVYNGQLSIIDGVLRVVVAASVAFVLFGLGQYLFRLYRQGAWPNPLENTVKRLPGVGVLIKTAQTFHYLKNISLCLNGGLALKQALKLSARRIPDNYFYRPFFGVYQAVEQGQKLSVALASSGILNDVPVGPMDMNNAGAAEAQKHLAEAVYLSYVEQLLFWARWLPQLLYAFLPIFVLIHLLYL